MIYQPPYGENLGGTRVEEPFPLAYIMYQPHQSLW